MDEMLNKYKHFLELDFSKLPSEHAVSNLGEFCDLSLDLKSEEGFCKVITIYLKLVNRTLPTTLKIILHYFAANAWAGLRLLRKANKDALWGWEQEEIENEIILLRKASHLFIECTEHSSLTPEIKCSIFTNLGNLLDHIGRYVEALEYWNKAIQEIPTFGMALGNKGRGLSTYASQLYDKGHIVLFLKFAYIFLNKSNQANDPNVFKEAKETFARSSDEIVAFLGNNNLTINQDLSDFSLGETESEIAYRKWCLKNTLFLNPLNDLGNYPIASNDVIHVPDLITSRDIGPDLQAFFNQLKQEYSYARYSLFDGLTMNSPHFADREVMLFIMPQNITYSIAIEKIKTSFRTAYSILDKIAYFINYYFNLNINDKRINFNTLWFNKQRKNKGLRKEFINRPNLSLRALFWLSRDLFESKGDFQDTIEPEAQQINELRNYIEHKYLKVQSNDNYDSFYEETYDFELTNENFLFLTRLDLEKKTLKLLKIVRSAIIYLSLAIEIEEREKRKTNNDALTLPIKLGVLKDKWKN